jgi:type I restriction enzyme R subunit
MGVPNSREINAVVKDLKLLKVLFQSKMEQKSPNYLDLIKHSFDDRDIDGLVGAFRDPARRKEFFREYKEIEMLYEIISPDAFLRPFLGDYATLSSIYKVVSKAFAKRILVDRDFLRKTNQLIQERVGAYVEEPLELVPIDENTIEVIKAKHSGDGVKVINLIKSIEREAEEKSDDPFLVAMADRAQAVQENFEGRQRSTSEALSDLLGLLSGNEERKKIQAEKGFDGLTYFVYRTLLDSEVPNSEQVSRNIKQAFTDCPNWKRSEKDLRELRRKVTFAILAELETVEDVTGIVEQLFSLLERATKI